MVDGILKRFADARHRWKLRRLLNRLEHEPLFSMCLPEDPRVVEIRGRTPAHRRQPDAALPSAYIAEALGALGDPSAIPALEQALKEAQHYRQYSHHDPTGYLDARYKPSALASSIIEDTMRRIRAVIRELESKNTSAASHRD